MENIILETVGIIASVLIVASMLFKTTTFKGTILMRSINLLGSAVFVVYGMLLPALATAIANILLLIVNSVYLVIEIQSHNRKSIE